MSNDTKETRIGPVETVQRGSIRDRAKKERKKKKTAKKSNSTNLCHRVGWKQWLAWWQKLKS